MGHSSIVEPIRWYCSPSGTDGVQYVQAECTAVNVAKKTLVCSNTKSNNKFAVDYDHLVVAVGAEPATFGIPGVAENAYFMKEIADSIEVQDKILQNLETANALLAVGGDEREVDRLLHWVVVGAGPTGVELTAELTDFIEKDIKKYFPRLESRCKVTLLEATSRILPTFDSNTANYAKKSLEERGATVMINSMVTKIDPNSIQLLVPDSSLKADDGDSKLASKPTKPSEISCGIVIWAGGITTRPLVKSIAAQLDSTMQSSRWGLVVDSHCRVKGGETAGLWALGDCAVAVGCAPTAQAASQQGKYLGRLFRDYLSGGAQTGELTVPLAITNPTEAFEIYDKYINQLPSFAYVNKGSLAYVGGNKGVAELKGLLWSNYPKIVPKDGAGTDAAKTIQVTGTGAFAIWRSLYFSKLMHLRNIFQVSFDWMKSSFFGRDISTPFRFEEFSTKKGTINAAQPTSASATASPGVPKRS